MYTATIDSLEDAEVALNVWMVASALYIRDLPDFIFSKLPEVLRNASLPMFPGLIRQMMAAWDLSRALNATAQEQGDRVLQEVMQFVLCKLQVRPPPA